MGKRLENPNFQTKMATALNIEISKITAETKRTEPLGKRPMAQINQN